ncbi:MAG: hypothetical protein AAFX65_10750 [Cyanobacteria bacterium J06638_7]
MNLCLEQAQGLISEAIKVYERGLDSHPSLSLARQLGCLQAAKAALDKAVVPELDDE